LLDWCLIISFVISYYWLSDFMIYCAVLVEEEELIALLFTWQIG